MTTGRIDQIALLINTTLCPCDTLPPLLRVKATHHTSTFRVSKTKHLLHTHSSDSLHSCQVTEGGLPPRTTNTLAKSTIRTRAHSASSSCLQRINLSFLPLFPCFTSFLKIHAGQDIFLSSFFILQEKTTRNNIIDATQAITDSLPALQCPTSTTLSSSSLTLCSTHSVNFLSRVSQPRGFLTRFFPYSHSYTLCTSTSLPFVRCMIGLSREDSRRS